MSLGGVRVQLSDSIGRVDGVTYVALDKTVRGKLILTSGTFPVVAVCGSEVSFKGYLGSSLRKVIKFLNVPGFCVRCKGIVCHFSSKCDCSV